MSVLSFSLFANSQTQSPVNLPIPSSFIRDSTVFATFGASMNVRGRETLSWLHNSFPVPGLCWSFNVIIAKPLSARSGSTLLMNTGISFGLIVASLQIIWNGLWVWTSSKQCCKCFGMKTMFCEMPFGVFPIIRDCRQSASGAGSTATTFEKCSLRYNVQPP